RGDNRFVRVSWDEALDMFYEELERVQKTHGPSALLTASGWQSTGMFHNASGMLAKAIALHGNRKFPRMKQALYVDSISSVTGSFIGTSSVTAYIESSSGVSVGGRTGLTAVVVGLLFLLVIFLSPLAGMVPGYAAAGALIYVGVLMTSSLARVNWQDLTESVPAFITAVMMPFSFSITEGIALGFISYCVMKIGTGRLRDLSPCVIIVALLFILKIVFIDAH
ncbi:solute carrier family 23 protein, partial [Escherichia coli]|uniref:solute carrier family 23 protein n=1 Tax=Escherichia coli TaxID=562 RepID=UPI000AD83745